MKLQRDLGDRQLRLRISKPRAELQGYKLVTCEQPASSPYPTCPPQALSWKFLVGESENLLARFPPKAFFESWLLQEGLLHPHRDASIDMPLWIRNMDCHTQGSTELFLKLHNTPYTVQGVPEENGALLGTPLNAKRRAGSM